MEHGFEHSDVFPVVARLINSKYLETGEFVPHRELVAAYLADPMGQSLVREARKSNSDLSDKQWASNMIAWFSQRFTVDDDSDFRKHFDRKRISRHWGYKPRQSDQLASASQSDMVLLRLTLHREFFAAILDGSKVIEYRDKTDYWEKRLKSKPFTHIQFRNGYHTIAPEMTVKLKTLVETNDCYELHLGEIVDTKNLEIMT